MSLLLACDPGLRRSGIAIYADGRLVYAGLAVSPERVVRGPRAWEAMAKAIFEAVPLLVDTLIVEQPQFDARTAGCASDVMELAGVVSTIVARSEGALHVSLPRPLDWKGNVPKGVTQARLWAGLSDDEWCNLSTDDHNALDAASLGLWHAKKTGERQ